MRWLLLLVAVNSGFGFSSLKILPGVREAGMGNAGVAGAEGPAALAWNPAAGADVSGFAASFTYTRWFLDSHKHSLFLVRNFGFMHFGLGLCGFAAGRFEYRNDVPTAEPLGEFVPGEYDFHLSASRSFGNRVQAGISGRFYYSKVFEYTASTFGLNIGCRVAVLENLKVGVSVTDFGGKPTYYRESFRLPTRARLGGTYGFCLAERMRANLALEGSYFTNEQEPNLSSGLELVWSDALALRCGYEWLDGTNRVSFGLGLVLGRLGLDYSLTPLNDNLGLAHRVAVSLGS